MRLALATVNEPIDYLNTHGTSTPIGDIKEIEAIRETFGDDMPWISSTKSLTGHSLGASGVHEAIYSLLMLEHDFVCASANIETLDPAVEGVRLARERHDHAGLNCVMSNSFGFGGTNSALVFQRYAG
jgi:3-oxoacyl-[acyl-carrier-protein] synthase-1